MKISLIGEEIKEAIIQYIVKQYNIDYNILFSNEMKISGRFYNLRKELSIIDSDLKCATIYIEINKF